MGKKMSPKIMRLFNSWYKEAKQKELNNPNAMSLATSTCFGVPSVRVVLLKSYNSKGFVFYTNIISQKGQELDTNPHASACFHWKSTNKQIRICGAVEQVGDEEIDDYFAGYKGNPLKGVSGAMKEWIKELDWELEPYRDVGFTGKSYIVYK